MKKLLSALAVLTALGGTGQAMADDSGYVFGVGFQRDNFDAGAVKDPDLGYFLQGGYQFDSMFSVLGGYKMYGEPHFGAASHSLDLDINALFLKGRAQYDIWGPMFVFGDLGVQRWDTEAKTTVDGVRVKADDSGTEVLYGAGIGFRNDRASFTIGYEINKMDDVDVDSISVALNFKF